MGTPLSAYLRERAEALSEGVIDQWELCRDERRIMAADHHDLFFVEELDKEDIVIHFEGMHPPDQPGMCNKEIQYTHGSGSFPSKFTFYDYEWYAGNDADEVCRLAQESPSKCVIYELDRRNGWGCSKWEPTNRWDYEKKRHVYTPSPLDAHGCYKRLATRVINGKERHVREVAYGPKVVARREKRRKLREGTEKQIAPDDKGFLRIHEIDEVTRALRDVVPTCSGIAWPDGWNKMRSSAIWQFKNALHLVWTITDLTTHRQCEAFQKLLAKWRSGTRAKDTREAWGAESLWKFLDAEAKKRKPPKREIKGKKLKFPWT